MFLTPAQVTAVCAQLRDENPLPTLIRFAAYTGLRAAEIAGLRVGDVDFDAVHIEVRQTMKRIGNVWTVGTPKSKRSTRTVPLLDRQLIGG
ncbi:MAG: tyrosine-type recombinase/integrase [Candidatus Microbacterium phytovorans]|uniref:Tyrosine-type recombinase/integrase n=1 Tax=Candidatus Microbacterium phytovorans TaxID=3121374 RepID=A0AAJ5W572_9MICO|nr:tyrosine-type recombinase/integrase [Microbacterium sp.]WEK14475.1 MAG: tyrosine-type recombinase/integrase [Microbacterium sp.]